MFDEENYPEDDCMKIGRILVSDIFSNKLMKISIKFIIILNVILVIVQTYQFLKIFEFFYLILYGPVFFGTFFVLASSASVLVTTDVINQNLKTMRIWKLENASGNCLKRIKFQSRFVNIFLVVNTVLALISGVFHMFPGEAEKIFFAFDIFQRLPSGWEYILSWFYRASFIVVSLTMPASCHQFIYATAHIRNQIRILLNCADILNQSHDQNQIKINLIIIMTRYYKIREATLRMRNQVRFVLLLYVYIAIILGICISLFWLTGELESNYPRAISLIIPGINTFLSTIISGQETENVGEEAIETFTSLKWYNWNKENRQMYLIFLSSISDPFEISLTENVSLNFNLGLRMSQALYSMISVFRQLN